MVLPALAATMRGSPARPNATAPTGHIKTLYIRTMLAIYLSNSVSP